MYNNYFGLKAIKLSEVVKDCVWSLSQIARRDGVVVRASASQSVDLGFQSYFKTSINGIRRFPVWRLAFS